MAKKKRNKTHTNHRISKKGARAPKKKRKALKQKAFKKGKRGKPKKKRTRSQAAKRGWVTRAQNKRKKTLAGMAALETNKKRRGKLIPLSEVKRLHSRIQELESQVRRTSDEREAAILAYIQAKGFVESDETVILTRLRLAEVEGRFEEEAGECSVEFDMALRDVYTLFMSPSIVTSVGVA